MRKDKLGKLYDRLDPDERFRLGLKAAARGDEEDMKRLRDTCPRETYTANDTAFTNRISGSEKMTMKLFQLLTLSLTKLRTLTAFREARPYTFDNCINEATTCLPTRPREGREPCLGDRWQERESTNKVVGRKRNWRTCTL